MIGDMEKEMEEDDKLGKKFTIKSNSDPIVEATEVSKDA
jgi:hypothetical protein